MSQSPYTPPTSNLTPSGQHWPARPKAVSWAACAVFLDCVLGLLYLVPGIATPEELSQPYTVIFAMVFVVVIIGLLIWGGIGILKGQNAARWAVLIIFALSLYMATTTSADPGQTIVRKVVDWISLLIEAAAMVLLFLDVSRQWFKDIGKLK